MVFLGKKGKNMNAVNGIFLRMKRKMADAGVCQTLMIFLAKMHQKDWKRQKGNMYKYNSVN
jgi:hypothetical protein